MLDVDEIVDELSKLSYREALAYWIKSEREEAEFYRELARRARDLGLGESLVRTFERLSEDSEKHSHELRRVFRDSYDEEPVSGIPPLEVVPVLEEFERADQVREILKAAMDSELVAMRVYRLLAEKAGDKNLRELYLRFAEVEKNHYEALQREYLKRG